MKAIMFLPGIVAVLITAQLVLLLALLAGAVSVLEAFIPAMILGAVVMLAASVDFVGKG